MTPHAFDAAAGDYDRSFTDRQPGRWFRDMVWAELRAVFVEGDSVLDLGCGTGEDAIWLTRQGLRVTALDQSTEMLATARRKATSLELPADITFLQRDLSAWDTDGEELTFQYDGALSNFGALNCVADLEGFARTLARCIRPGGAVVLVVMGPWCPWEVAAYLVRLRVPTALRRFRRSVRAHVGDGQTVDITYPSPRRLAAAFSPGFEQTRLVGIGSLLPPPYLSRLVAAAMPLFRALAGLERRLGPYFPWNRLNDHYLMVLRRRTDEQHTGGSMQG